MRTLLACIIFLALTYSAQAQHEFYTSCAYTYGIPMNFGGSFFKLDSLGNNMHTIHNFDSVTGSYAMGAVIQATNGKLYGVTARGGANNEGVLFEYDPTIDSYSVKLDIPMYDRASYNLMQASDGKIYYASSGSFQHIMEYDIAANTLTRRAYIPYPKVSVGALTEVSGKLYGITPLGGVSGYGQLFEYNMATQVLTYVYDFVAATGYYPKSQPVQATDGLLYGTTRYSPAGMGDPRGGLYSFNPATHAYTLRATIPADIGAVDYLTAAPNGRIYGMGAYGTDISGNHFGCIFEFNPATNAIRITHNFGSQNYGAVPPSVLFTGTTPLGGLKLGSNGKMYGATTYSAFEYDYVTDTVWPRANPVGFQTNTNAYFCEICRKPSYRFFAADTTTVCSGTAYGFTIHSDNAKTFQWKKNGAVLGGQTDSILSFTTIAVTDSGTYTCLMTNHCGITETMTSIRLLVHTPPPAGTISAPASLCEGTTAALSYSTAGAGTWSSSNVAVATVDPVTGVLSAVSGGSAFLSYSMANACGTTITSAMVTVTPLPQAGTITGAINVCEGAVASVSNTATSGTWSSTNVAVATIDNYGVMTGIAAGSTVINYAVANGCGAAVATASITVNPLPQAGTITGGTALCIGDQLALSDDAAGGTWSSDDVTLASVNTAGVVAGIAAGNVVISYAVTNGCGTATATLPLMVQACTTGLTEYVQPGGMIIYPNPTQGACTFRINSNVDGLCNITVQNVAGQRVYSKEIATNKTILMNMELSPGLYIIRAITEASSYEARLMVYR